MKTEMDWLNEVEIEDLLDGDLRLIHDVCGKNVLFPLVANFSKMNLYINNRFLPEAKKRYIRKVYDRNIDGHAKILSHQLDMSIRSVFEALEETEPQDDRQGRLL